MLSIPCKSKIIITQIYIQMKFTVKIASTPKTINEERKGHESVFKDLAPVVQKVDNGIHPITHFPLGSTVGFIMTFPLDGDLSGG